MENGKSTIDLIWTNKAFSFRQTRISETELTNYHKVTATFFKSHSTRSISKVIYCIWITKNLRESDFFCHLNMINFEFFTDDLNRNYNFLTKHFLHAVKKHAPSK